MHKLHPLWGTIADVVTNEDFYGVKIRQEDDPWYTQLRDTVEHVGESFVPFSVKNLQRFKDAGERPAMAWMMALSGITSAPAYISRSAAANLANEFVVGNIPSGSRTTEQAEASTKRRDLIRRMRAGKSVSETEMAAYSKRELKRMETEAGQASFTVTVKRLRDEQVMKVWAVSTPKEKSQIRKALQSRFVLKASEKKETEKAVAAAAQAKHNLGQLGVKTYDEAVKTLGD